MVRLMEHAEKDRNIRRAISLAKNPGACTYTKNDEPICVIAQLYVLEGGDLKDLKEYDRDDGGDPIFTILKNSNKIKGVLGRYDEDLLDHLQEKWDEVEDTTNDKFLRDYENEQTNQDITT